MLKVRQSPLPEFLAIQPDFERVVRRDAQFGADDRIGFRNLKGGHSRTVCLLNVALSQIQQPNPLVTSGRGAVDVKDCGELLATAGALAPAWTRAKEKAKTEPACL